MGNKIMVEHLSYLIQNDKFHWSNMNVSILGFNYIAPYICNLTTSSIERQFDSFGTFLIQFVRLSIAITALFAILALYNSINVLRRTVLSVASCSLHWVILFALVVLKSVILVILLPVSGGILKMEFKGDNKTFEDVFTYVNYGGFIIITVIQVLTTFILFCAYEHEFRCRSAELSSVVNPLTKRCASLNNWRLFVTIPRGVMLVNVILLFALLITIELLFTVNNKFNYIDIPRGFPVIIVWFILLFLLRVGVVIMGVALLFIQNPSFKLTIPAKIYVIASIVLLAGEDIPSSLLNMNHYDDELIQNCYRFYNSPYDYLQLMGGLGFIFLFLFVRSQYLRIEQESKLSVVWDMQRLLQVNGRKNVHTHYT